MHTLTRNTLRELLADTIRAHRSDAPYDCTDAVLATIKLYAPKAFVEDHVSLTEDDRYSKIATDLLKTKAFDIDRWEIQAAYPLLSEDEVTQVDDLIGLAQVSVTF